MLLPFLLLSALHTTPADSLSGTWRFAGDVVGNPVNEICTLKQAGAKLTGSCKNTDAADAKPYDVTGEIKDGKFSFSHGGEYQGQALTMTYAGALPTGKGISGTIGVVPFDVNGQFTAAPMAAAPVTAAADTATPAKAAPAAPAKP